MTKAVLHIGTVKTGSSSLQKWLAGHPRILREKGYFYSRSAGRGNHIRLPAYAQADDKRDDTRANLSIGSADDLRKFRADLATGLEAEVRDRHDRTFLFSCELCHARLVTLSEVRRLRDLLAALFDEVRVIVYLRRQDKVATSGYTTMLGLGATDEDVLHLRAVDRELFDYFATLSCWAEAFAEENLSIRLYDEAMRTSGSIISDFCSDLGVALPAAEARSINISLKPPYQEFLRLLNRHAPRPGGGMQGYGELAACLARFGAGPGRLPSREAAERFYAAFRESNEALRRKWFPDRPFLFDESFDDHPATSAPPELDDTAVFSIFARLWEEAGRDRALLSNQLAAARREIARLQAVPDRPPQKDGTGVSPE